MCPIVIIEEDNHWVVSFHSRGNGLIVRQAEGVYSFPMFRNRSPRPYYLSKNQLELIEKPEGSIERTSQLTIYNGLEVSTNYPDDNVDSFMAMDEAMRRNHEIWLKETGQLEGDNPKAPIDNDGK